MILTIVTCVIEISFLYIKIYEKISSESEKKVVIVVESTSNELSITGLVLHHPLPIGTSFKFFTHY